MIIKILLKVKLSFLYAFVITKHCYMYVHKEQYDSTKLLVIALIVLSILHNTKYILDIHYLQKTGLKY